MKSRLTIDRPGRVVIPKAVRDRLKLLPGDPLNFEFVRDKIVLLPVRCKQIMFKKHGLWVMKTGRPLPVEIINDTIELVREERHRQIVGRMPK